MKKRCIGLVSMLFLGLVASSAFESTAMAAPGGPTLFIGVRTVNYGYTTITEDDAWGDGYTKWGYYYVEKRATRPGWDGGWTYGGVKQANGNGHIDFTLYAPTLGSGTTWQVVLYKSAITGPNAYKKGAVVATAVYTIP